MSSLPPPARRASAIPPLAVKDAAGRHRLCLALYGAPPQTCRTEANANGITFDTRLDATIRACPPCCAELATSSGAVTLQHSLPVDLTPLIGHAIELRLSERFERRWTRRLELREPGGRPFLIAHDGPLRPEVHGGPMRIAITEGTAAVLVDRGRGPRRLAPGRPLPVRVEGVSMALHVLRVSAEDASLVWLAA